MVTAETKENPVDTLFLTAYIVSNRNKNFAASELRDFLLKELPEYMIPSYFVQMDFLPLTPNGKVNKNALKSVGVTLTAGTEFVPPKNDLEKIIAITWQEILNIETVGVNDNFFDLGGNSVNIIHLSMELKKKLARDIPMAKMFQYPTIASFAAYLQMDNHPPGNTGEGVWKKEEDLSADIEWSNTKNRLKQRRNRANE